ncbi:MAG: DUF3971 domain-containing protein, partial [Acetobacteraceae bacterium]|nr:DUF3971 domain-containing protein [Acetobacteraceae bacterium]
MSAVEETRQPASGGWTTAWHILRWPAKALRLLLGLVLVVCVLLALAATGLAWRLAQGPLDVTWLARKAETLLMPKGGGPKWQVGRVTLAWSGFNSGAHSGLEIRLHDLQAPDRGGGGPAASIGQADVSLAPGPLLSATIAPRSIVLDQVRLRATRDAEGAIHFAVVGSGGGDGGAGNILAELRRPGGSAQSDPTLRDLELVVLEHATVTLEDEASHRSIEGVITDLVLRRRDGGGITGAANGKISAGGASVSLAMSATVLADGTTHVETTLAPLGTHDLEAALLTRLDPALASIGLDTTVTAQASVDLTSALRPVRGTLTISAGPGTLAVPNSSPVHFARLAIAGKAGWDENSMWPRTWTIDPIDAVVVADGQRESTARITVDATRQDAQYEAHATIGLDHASFADLPSLWPATWGGHVRPWLTENVTAGEAHDAAITATVAIPLADPAKANVLAAGGTMLADEVVIHWLRPVPPIENAQAILKVLGPDELVIDIPRASQGPIALRDGVLRFTGLSHKDQDLAITTKLHGRVPDLIKVLREPRLKLLSAHPVPITDSAGQFSASLSVKLPLVHHLTFEQVTIESQGQLQNLRLGGLVAGRDLEHGDVSFDVTQDGLKASGAATVA